MDREAWHAVIHGVTKRAFLVAQRVKRLPTMWKTWVQSLSREVPLEKEMATHSIILPWEIPRTEVPGGLYSPRGRGPFTEVSNADFAAVVK